MINNILLLLTTLLWYVGSPAQSETNLPVMRNVLQRDLYNPAAFGYEGWHLGLPSALYDVYHEGPAFGDLVERDGGDPYVKGSELLKLLAPNQDNLGVINWRIQTLKLKYTNTNWSFGFEHEILSESDFTYPTELVELIVNGNQQYIGQEVEIGPDIRIENMHSFGFLVSKRWGNFSLGLRPKLLTGINLAYTPSSSARLYTDDAFYEVRLTTNYQLFNVGLVDFEDGNLLNFAVNDKNGFQLFNEHMGFSLDGGVTWEPWNRMEAGLSFTDLGSIHWKTGGQSYASEKSSTYSGLEAIGLFSVDQIQLAGALDSLRALFDLTAIQEDLRLQRPANYHCFMTYDLTTSLTLALQVHYNSRFANPWVYGLSMSTYLPSGTLLGVNISQRFEEFQLGLHGAVPLGHWMLFAAVDNILQGLSPINSNQFNVRAGVNYHFRRLDSTD